MIDVFSREERSDIMRRVKSARNKSTELELIRLLRSQRITGWRRSYPLLGSPDFTFPKKKLVVFVDGCFWHGHNCRNLSPQTNRDYWKRKIARNKRRDLQVNRELRTRGWKVLRIWECRIKRSRQIKKVL